MQTAVLVVVIEESVVHNGYLFTGTHDECVRTAEAKFLELCREKIRNFDEYTQADLDVITEDGYETWGNGNFICIHWPNVINLATEDKPHFGLFM